MQYGFSADKMYENYPAACKLSMIFANYLDFVSDSKFWPHSTLLSVHNGKETSKRLIDSLFVLLYGISMEIRKADGKTALIGLFITLL